MYIVSIYNSAVETIIHDEKEKLDSGKIVKGINTIDSFTFSMLPNNAGFAKINEYKTIVKAYNANKDRYDFIGRVLYAETSMDEDGFITKNVTCESVAGYLCDSIQNYVEEQNWTVSGLLQHLIECHNSQVEYYKQFKIGEITVKDNNDNVYLGIQRENTWNAIQSKLISTLGGELQFRVEDDGNYIDYKAQIGKYKTTPIALSVNMKAITQERDPTEFITRLIPLGCKLTKEVERTDEAGNVTVETVETEHRLDITSVNGGVNYITDEDGASTYGIHVGVVLWDDVTTASALLTKGQNWLAENNRVRVKYSITALDLSLIGLAVDDFDVGNTYPIANKLMGISDRVRLVKKSIDICNEVESTIEIGDNVKSLSDIQRSQVSQLQAAINNINELKSSTSSLQNSVSTSQQELINQMNTLNARTDEIDTTLNQRVSNMEETLGTTVNQLETTFDTKTSKLADLFDNRAVRLEETFATEIQQLSDSISLSVNGSLGSKANIILSAGANEQSYELDLSQVRQAFADDETAISISAGLITFNAGTLVINSTKFMLDSEGVITATGGTIGAITLSDSGIYSHNEESESSFAGWYRPETITTETGCFFAGATDQAGADAKFSVTYGGKLTATDAKISGEVTATTGEIGGWTLKSYKLYAGDGVDIKTVCMQAPTENNLYVFAAGGTSHDSYADCPFRVTKAGKLYATDAIVHGDIITIDGVYKTEMDKGSIRLYYDDVLCGTINTKYWSGAATEGVSLRVEEGGKYIMFSHADDTQGSGYVVDYYLNAGWSSNYDEMHIFQTSARFLDGIYVSGPARIRSLRLFGSDGEYLVGINSSGGLSVSKL